MASEFIAGKSGYILVDGNEQKLSKWRFKPRAKILPRNTFVANGKDVNIAGFVGADVTLEGPYATPGELIIEVGEVIRCNLGIEPDGPTEFELDIRVSDAEVSNDAEDGPKIVINGVSTGDFEPATV